MYIGFNIHSNNMNFIRTLQFNPETSNYLTGKSDTELTLSLSTRCPLRSSKKCHIHSRTENVEDAPPRI